MPLPKKWRNFYIGRKVIHRKNRSLEGVVKYAATTRLGRQGDASNRGAIISSAFCVEWQDGATQVLEDTEVAKIATDEFVQEDWVLDRILKLQECGWDEEKADAVAILNAAKLRNTPLEQQNAPRINKPSKKPPKNPAAMGGGVSSPRNKNEAYATTLTAHKRKADQCPSTAAPSAKRPALFGVGKSPVPAATKATTKKPPSFDRNSSTGRERGIPKATATSPKRIASPKAVPAPSPGRGGSTSRIVAPLLHVSNLNPTKVKGKDVFPFDEVTVNNVKYRVYSKHLIVDSEVCFRAAPKDGKPGDLSIDTWKVREKYEPADEYLIDCIAAERTVGGEKGAVEYLMKFTKFELDPGPEAWLPLEEVHESEAYDKWLKGGRKRWLQGGNAVKKAAGLDVKE